MHFVGPSGKATEAALDVYAPVVLVQETSVRTRASTQSFRAMPSLRVVADPKSGDCLTLRARPGTLLVNQFVEVASKPPAKVLDVEAS
jgi:hypothetical protein